MEMFNINFGGFVLITAIITLAMTLIIRDIKTFIPEVLWFAVLLLINTNSPPLLYVLFAVQAALTVWIIVRYIKAARKNYLLILEKTHHIPPHFTKGGSAGI
ncbi:hypothetical protein [Bacillus piscicola]|uniref:hypothetical protein n=1 Tax=Bacillus piscicola TaxID=1632684 RepID=UPI001F099A89|nr:hypothetical protein [Bacillus piscicola]